MTPGARSQCKAAAQDVVSTPCPSSLISAFTECEMSYAASEGAGVLVISNLPGAAGSWSPRPHCDCNVVRLQEAGEGSLGFQESLLTDPRSVNLLP